MKELKILSAALFIIIFGAVSVHQAKAQKSQNIILAGYKQKPPVKTSGTGMAKVTLKNDTLSIGGDFKNLTSSFSGAYLMVSIKGRGGNQLHRIKVDLNDERTGGTIDNAKNQFVLTESEKKLLKMGELYINIVTFDHHTGELRGDIRPMGG